jgi:hypothetical protein
VAPAAKAKLVVTDPWSMYEERTTERRDRPLYIALADLGRHYHEGFDRTVQPTPEIERAVLEFATEWGLLGELMAEVSWVRLPHGRYWRLGGEWLFDGSQGGAFECERITVRGPWVSKERDTWWFRHFGFRTRRDGRRQAVHWDHPLMSEGFRAAYREPVEAILVHGARMARILEGLEPGAAEETFYEAMTLAARMTMHTTPLLDRGSGRLRQRWATGSLLEMAALMAVFDADRLCGSDQGGASILRCDHCGRWFRRLDPRVKRHCSPACQKAAWQRARRGEERTRAPKRRGRPPKRKEGGRGKTRDR